MVCFCLMLSSYHHAVHKHTYIFYRESVSLYLLHHSYVFLSKSWYKLSLFLGESTGPIVCLAFLCVCFQQQHHHHLMPCILTCFILFLAYEHFPFQMAWLDRCEAEIHVVCRRSTHSCKHTVKSQNPYYYSVLVSVCVCFVPAWARLFIFTCLCAHVTKSTGFSSAKTRVLHSLLSKVEGEVKKEKKACTREKEEAYSRHYF